IKTTESNNSLLDSSPELLHEDNKNVLIVVAQGIILMLVHLLDFSSLREIMKKIAPSLPKSPWLLQASFFGLWRFMYSQQFSKDS
ncbi:hypothetical protein H5410_035926, partial [Solanum commersonii]